MDNGCFPSCAEQTIIMLYEISKTYDHLVSYTAPTHTSYSKTQFLIGTFSQKSVKCPKSCKSAKKIFFSMGGRVPIAQWGSALVVCGQIF